LVEKLLEDVLRFQLRLLDQRREDLDLQYQTARAYHYLGICYQDGGRLDDARAAYRAGASLWQRVHGERPKHVMCRVYLAATDLYLGMLQYDTGEFSDARHTIRRAIAEFEDLAENEAELRDWNRRNVALCYCILGDIHVECGRLDEADACYHKARIIQEPFFHQDRTTLPLPSNTDSLERLASNDDGTGRQRYLSGRSEEALAFLSLARERRQQLVDADPAHIRRRSSLARTDLHLGIVYHALGQREKARSALQQAYTVLEPLVRENPEVIDFQKTLAEIHLQMGKLLHKEGCEHEARRSFEQARQISEKLLRAHPTGTQVRVTLAESYTGTSHVLQAQGQQAKALLALCKAQAVWQELVNDHPDIPRFQNGLVGIRSERIRQHAKKAKPVHRLPPKQYRYRSPRI
jgi:tetratricopeptide (TPR) repeat protein